MKAEYNNQRSRNYWELGWLNKWNREVSQRESDITNTINFVAEILSSNLLFVTLKSFDYNLHKTKSEHHRRKLNRELPDEQ